MGTTVINAKTKNRQPQHILKAMAGEALHAPVQAFFCEELGGGLCNAVYKVQCDGTTYVLKIGTSEQVDVMAHEADYLKVEADMLKLFGDSISIQAPHLIHYDDTGVIIPEPWFMMEYLEGEPLLQAEQELSREEREKISYAIGEICCAISSIPAPAFGIPGVHSSWSDKNSEFMQTLFQLLYQDAKKAGFLFQGTSPEEVLMLLVQCKDLLDEVKEPCHVHTDTWAGNILMKGHNFSGLVDYAAILYGDPLMNHDFHDFSPEPSPSFLKAFGKTELTEHEQVRVIIYKIWQRLGMMLENSFRGYDDPGHYGWVVGEYEKEIQNLKDRMRK